MIDSTIMFFVTPILDGDLGQGSYDIRATKAVVARGKQQGRRHQPKMWGATNPKGTVRTMYCGVQGVLAPTELPVAILLEVP